MAMKMIRNEHGNAMIITLMLLIILTALGIYAVSISTTEMSMSFRWKSGAVGFNAAESGVYEGFDLIGPSLGSTSFPIGNTLPNLAVYSGGGVLTGMTVAPGYGGGYRYASYEINSTGHASGFTDQRTVQAVVEYGPMPVGTMY
jgi:hypothetical protein